MCEEVDAPRGTHEARQDMSKQLHAAPPRLHPGTEKDGDRVEPHAAANIIEEKGRAPFLFCAVEGKALELRGRSREFDACQAAGVPKCCSLWQLRWV